jgi:hypothetical protein
METAAAIFYEIGEIHRIISQLWLSSNITYMLMGFFNKFRQYIGVRALEGQFVHGRGSDPSSKISLEVCGPLQKKTYANA